MRKSLTALGLAALFGLSVSSLAFAGEWRSDANGWWYQNDDGSYLQNGWHEINGKQYYFQPDGYILTDTVTPDGYVVDADGAWLPEGAESGQVNEPKETTRRFADVSKYFNTDLQDYEKAKVILNVQPFQPEGGMWFEEHKSTSKSDYIIDVGDDDENMKYIGYKPPVSLYNENSSEYYKQNSFKIYYDINTNQIVRIVGDPELFINEDIRWARELKPIAEEAGATDIVYKNEDTTTTSYGVEGNAFVANGTVKVYKDDITFTWNNLKYSYKSHDGEVGGNNFRLVISRN